MSLKRTNVYADVADLALIKEIAARRGVPEAQIIEFILAQARLLRFQIPETGLAILDTARLIQQQYASLDLDLADAVNVALAAQYRTDAVLTLDRRDFRAMRPLTPHKWFRLLPDDL